MNQIVEIVLDIETTGLSLKGGHKIIEIGCVELINRKKTGRTFHQYINPQRKVDPEAIAVHGIKDDFLRDKPIFPKIAPNLRDFIGEAHVVAHNGLAFDIPFLNYEFAISGIELLCIDKVIDTLVLARKMYPGSPASLDALCRKFGISLVDRKLHGALLDALLLTNVYIAIKAPMQGKIFIANESKRTYHNEVAIVRCDSRRSFYLSDYEASLYENMLQKLSNPLWAKLKEK
jgi:DNA polymerase-3 subunit epsilon